MVAEVVVSEDVGHIVLAAERIAAVRSGHSLQRSVSRWSKQELVHRLGPGLEREREQYRRGLGCSGLPPCDDGLCGWL